MKFPSQKWILFSISILLFSCKEPAEPEPPKPIDAFLKNHGMFISNAGDTIYNDTVEVRLPNIIWVQNGVDSFKVWNEDFTEYTKYYPFEFIYIRFDRNVYGLAHGITPEQGGLSSFGEFPTGEFIFMIAPDFDSVGVKEFGPDLIGQSIDIDVGPSVRRFNDSLNPSTTHVLTNDGRRSLVYFERKGITGRFLKYTDYGGLGLNQWQYLDGDSAKVHVEFTGFNTLERDGHTFDAISFKFRLDNVESENHPGVVGSMQGDVYMEYIALINIDH